MAVYHCVNGPFDGQNRMGLEPITSVIVNLTVMGDGTCKRNLEVHEATPLDPRPQYYIDLWPYGGFKRSRSLYVGRVLQSNLCYTVSLLGGQLPLKVCLYWVKAISLPDSLTFSLH